MRTHVANRQTRAALRGLSRTPDGGRMMTDADRLIAEARKHHQCVMCNAPASLPCPHQDPLLPQLHAYQPDSTACKVPGCWCVALSYTEGYRDDGDGIYKARPMEDA